MTRVVIEDPTRPQEALELVNRSVSMDRPPAMTDEWYLRADGLDDAWYAPPDAKGSLEDDPSGNGSFEPDEFYVGSRVFPIRGGLWSRSSSVAQGVARAKLARLHNRPLWIMVDDEQGKRWVRGIARQQPKIARPSIYRLEFTLFITCPDPVKMGEEVRYERSGGAIWGENGGDAATWPMFYAKGPVSVIALSHLGHLLAWAGNSSSGVTIDPRTGIVTNGAGDEIGGLQADDVFKIGPGLAPVGVSTDSTDLRMGVRAGWL